MSFTLFDPPSRGYAAIGGVAVALCRIAVGVLGTNAPHQREEGMPAQPQDDPVPMRPQDR